ncbi:hypothetical protein P2G42_21815 [Klebsiella electrica]|uniref:hypothetical protein n=1 Tax=Klebsiella electrica TaxID=1259973 RepID=UPI0025529B4D|nr:hypothetical protein [Klebsiella electrica]WIO42468.1 hypothetical protein P2G42_21815 [Klebsiella electrica]
MTNDKSNGVITEPLPDLTRLFKNRARDGSIIKKCKILLIAGVPPQRVSLLLRLPLEKVQELYDNSYNPRCRRFARQNPHTNEKLALTSFNEGEKLADIAAGLALPLFTLVIILRQNGVPESAINARMPPADDPLYVEYRKVVARKSACKQKTIQISPPRRVRKAAGTAATA